MPGADSFSPRKGRPSYVEAHAGTGADRRLVGYVFLSTDIVDIPAYSGKPVVTLIGMDTKGIITGVKVLKHSEPILLLGIPNRRWTASLRNTSASMPATRSRLARRARRPAMSASTRSAAPPSR